MRTDWEDKTMIWVLRIYVESWTEELKAIRQEKMFEGIPTDIITIGSIELF